MKSTNILFFLIPKSQVVYGEDDYTLRQVSEKLQSRGYTAIPILNKDGQYLYTVSDGDLFWYIKENSDLNLKKAEGIPISSIKRRREVKAIKFDAEVKSLFNLIVEQNFVPVLDDKDVFMGIVTRRSIIEYLTKLKDAYKKS